MRTNRLPSIATVFFVIMFGLTAVAGTAVALWRGNELYARERHEMLERDSLYAHTLARSVSIYLDSAVTVAETLAREAEVEPSLSHANLQPLVQRFAVQNAGTYLSMYVIGLDGVEIADFHPTAENDAEKIAGIGVDLSDRSYFRKVLEERRPTVSEAVIGRSTKRPVVVVTAPVFDGKGNIVAVAAGSLDLTALGELASQAVFGDPLMPVIVDASGQVVVHRDPSFVGALRDFSAMEPAKRALAGVSGTIEEYEEPDGQVYGAAFKPVPEFGWGVWIAQGGARLDAVAGVAARDAALAFVLIMALSGLAFVFASRFLFLPLRRMAVQADRIADGDLDGTIDLSGAIVTAEVAGLAERFTKMSEELKASLGVKAQFLGVVSHVFRTPISGIKWEIESWLDRGSEMTAEQRAAWLGCARSAQRLQIAFDNVLVAQEIGAKSVHPSAVDEVDLGPLLKNTAGRFELLAAEEGVALVVHAAESIRIHGDEKRLAKVFEIVIANAIMYGNAEGKAIVSLDREKDHAVVRVDDSGIGMTDEDRLHAGTPFFRGELAKKKYVDGAGLGLYIAKAYVEMHRGSIEFMPGPTGGTVVVIRLPLDAIDRVSASTTTR